MSWEALSFWFHAIILSICTSCLPSSQCLHVKKITFTVHNSIWNWSNIVHLGTRWYGQVYDGTPIFNYLSACRTRILTLLLLFHQTCSAKHSHKCAPSSCGNIHNIRYPFRLMRDPADCGDSRYSLSCVNNRILVFYLFGGKYYVREVSYDSFNIRVVDSGMQMDKYSSIPPLYSKPQ